MSAPPDPHRPVFVHFEDEGVGVTACGTIVHEELLATDVPELVTCQACIHALAFDVVLGLNTYCHFCDDTGWVQDMAAEVREPCPHCLANNVVHYRHRKPDGS